MASRRQTFQCLIRCRLFLAIFLLLFRSATAADNSTYVAGETLLINCGSSGRASDPEYRQWHGDAGSTFLPPLAANNSIVANADSLLPTIPAVPFTTARVFTSPATYSIPVGPDRKFVRLYFYPVGYSGSHRASDAVFDVTAGPHVLLRSFSPVSDAATRNTTYVVREYSLNVSATAGYLNITFTPSASYPGSFAFVNGIEVISIPDVFAVTKPILWVRSALSVISLNASIAFETMYRLNVGGASVLSTGDSGLFRRWDDDTVYLLGDRFTLTHRIDPNITLRYTVATPRYIAPDVVYMTQRSMSRNASMNTQANLSWMFTIDPGFFYMMRLHYCEIQTLYNKPNQRAFDVYINNMTADVGIDVFQAALVSDRRIGLVSGLGVPIYQDYAMSVPNGHEQVELRLDLHPSTKKRTEYVDAVLNGLEIFKLCNSSDGSLAWGKPVRSGNKANKHEMKKIVAIVSAVVGSFVVVFVLFYIISRRRQTSSKVRRGKSSVGCRFSFAEIEAATKGFDESHILGVGGFGKVYKGVIHVDRYVEGGGDSPTAMSKVNRLVEVAIKRANPRSKQGSPEFLNEIHSLSRIRHRHLVGLIGFCDEHGEMILVYDYMANGTLRDHLYNDSEKPILGWQQRLEICVGVARGLHYLHTGQNIIHRDVKSTNILLNEEWIPKLADFGLSKVGPQIDHQETHVSTAVKGTFGYLDPEYYRRMQLTDKSDVYSFGVVLFEVLCGRPAMNETLPPRQINLANWVRQCHKRGSLLEIVDPYLDGQIATQCFSKFVDIAYSCISLRHVNRPSMGDVLRELEFALQEQETAVGIGPFEGISVKCIQTPPASDKSLSTDLSASSFGFDSISSDGFVSASHPSAEQFADV